MKVDILLQFSFLLLFIGLLSLFFIMEFVSVDRKEEYLFEGKVKSTVNYNDTTYIYVEHFVTSKILIKGNFDSKLAKGENILVYGEDIGDLVVAEKILRK